MGGLAALLVTRPNRADRKELFVVPYYVASVAGLAFGGVIGATVASGLMIAVLVTLLRSTIRIGSLALGAGVAGLTGAAAMAVLPDQHGFAVLAGAALGLLLSPRLDPTRASRGDSADAPAFH